MEVTAHTVAKKLLNINNIANILLSRNLETTKTQFQTWSSANGFTLLLKNNDDALSYYAIRCQNKRMKGTLKRLQSHRFPKSDIIFKTDKIPSGVNLYNALKQMPVAKSKGNNFFLDFNDIMAELYRLCDID